MVTNEWESDIKLQIKSTSIESENYELTLFDIPGNPNYIENTIIGLTMSDAVLLIISAEEDFETEIDLH